MPNGRRSFKGTHLQHTFAMLETIAGKDKNIWRKDRDGKIICFPSYGDDKSKYGWNIHHINMDASIETINELYDNLEAVSIETHKAIHRDPEEKNRIKTVKYILTLNDIPADGIRFPKYIKINGYEAPYLDSAEIANLLMDHIKKGRK